MALRITPTPGNGARVTCTNPSCGDGVTLTGFDMAVVRSAVEVVEAEHRCAA